MTEFKGSMYPTATGKTVACAVSILTLMAPGKVESVAWNANRDGIYF